MYNSNELYLNINEVLDEIREAYSKSGLTSGELFTLKEYHKNGGSIDGRSLRQFGGFSALLKLAIPEAFGDSNKLKYDVVRQNKYVSRLETNRHKYEHLKNAVLEASVEALKNIQPIRGQKSYVASKRKKGLRRMNVALLSDTHFGLDIDPRESMGNTYNWSVAANRLSKFMEQIAEFKIDHRDDCEGVALLLGGDLGQGVVHWSTDYGTKPLADQIVGISSYIIQSVQYLRQHFGRVEIYFTTDNHMRATYRHGDRATGQKWDSFSIPIATALEARFMECEDVSIHFDKSPINTFRLLGHKYGLTHGDTHVNTGNIGNSINIASISKQLLSLNAVQPDGPYDVICMGHVHTPLRIAIANAGTEVIINGTMSGTDAYAGSLGFFRTMSCQTLWECTEEYPVGDFRIVHLDKAQNVDSIIMPYQDSLHLPKI